MLAALHANGSGLIFIRRIIIGQHRGHGFPPGPESGYLQVMRTKIIAIRRYVHGFSINKNKLGNRICFFFMFFGKRFIFFWNRF